MATDEQEVAAARLLVAEGWHPWTKPIRRGLDVRDWMDCVRVLLQRLDAAEAALVKAAEMADNRAPDIHALRAFLRKAR